MITKNKQVYYNDFCKTCSNLTEFVPTDCGENGVNCNNMDKVFSNENNICIHCGLYKFVKTVDSIVERCDEKAAIGIEKLYDSDIYDVTVDLKNKGINVSVTYVSQVLDYITKEV